MAAQTLAPRFDRDGQMSITLTGSSMTVYAEDVLVAWVTAGINGCQNFCSRTIMTGRAGKTTVGHMFGYHVCIMAECTILRTVGRGECMVMSCFVANGTMTA